MTSFFNKNYKVLRFSCLKLRIYYHRTKRLRYFFDRLRILQLLPTWTKNSCIREIFSFRTIIMVQIRNSDRKEISLQKFRQTVGRSRPRPVVSNKPYAKDATCVSPFTRRLKTCVHVHA